MLISNAFLLIFALAFMGCILATPLVTRIAVWAGAIDRPDQFRRIHKGATPRLGGLGMAFGVALAIILFVQGGYLDGWPGLAEWWPRQGSVLLAASIVLAIGVVDDTRNMGPRAKLLGQASAVIVLYWGGIRIQSLDLLGLTIDLGSPSFAVSVIGSPIARIGNRIEMADGPFNEPSTPITPIRSPIIRLPLSPRKMQAGCQL